LIRRMIMEQLENLHNFAQENIGVMLMGDMNALEASAPIQWATKEWRNNDGISVLPNLVNAKFVSQLPHHGPTGTFTGFRFETRPPILIDYIFVNNTVQVRTHGVLADVFDNDYPPSDHRPVVCDVQIV